jgi:Alpha/beta hydrolase of unknown function (DUF900)
VRLAADRLSRGSDKSALVFIHGFRESFRDEMRRAAQLGFDLDFPGLITAFRLGGFTNMETERALSFLRAHQPMP